LELKFRFSFTCILGRDAVIRPAAFVEYCAFLARNPDWKQALMDGKKSSANGKERKAANLFLVDA